MTFSYCNIVGVAGVDSCGGWAVCDKEIIEGRGEHGTLWDATPHDTPPGDACEVLAGRCSAPQVGREPADCVWVEVAIANFGQEDGVVNGIKGFGVVDGDGGCAGGRFVLVEAVGDGGGDRE